MAALRRNKNKKNVVPSLINPLEVDLLKLITKIFPLFLLVLFFAGCTPNSPNPGENPPSKEEMEAAGAIRLVETFGQQLQKVFLLAPKEELEATMEEAYGDLVDPALFEVWIEDPLGAPGRLKSSPIPERIEEIQVLRLPEGSFEVQGVLVETDQGQNIDRRDIRLVVSPLAEGWRITQVSLDPEERPGTLLYENGLYGFNLSLPLSWTGYEVIETQWEGQALKGDQVLESGPLFLIRHPLWSQEIPRQDIPILVFTLDQWTSLEKEAFHLGAAPVGPRELGRSDSHVFALPARYNFAFPEGHEEVTEILDQGALQVASLNM